MTIKRTSELTAGDMIRDLCVADIRVVGPVTTPTGEVIELFEIIFTNGKSRAARDAVN